ncbi:hypothetical protein [Dyadobacter sandarakinus]|uniref:Lipocalin-like domain-containing protein n=1 Tax=Dyadobacter sandarakinus TaxID=2747268 RepID=A0ABX7I0N2_9BACT|nr:hypothetical protein [Dyadobacter sandarakinus]QRQ99558.1 hypothetical protein HWI92_00825 [Dyadobacter sandarakinus]
MRAKAFLSAILFMATTFLPACDRKAGNVQEAVAILTDAKKWRIDQILVNDAVTFRDGKMLTQFGGVQFESYMETVELRPDGTFSGVFKGAAGPFLLQWKAEQENISITDPKTTQKGGEWLITPADVSPGGFTMTTRSTAYDYPNMTKIALKFKPAS